MMNVPRVKMISLSAGSILIAFIDVEKQFLMNWEDFFVVLWFRIADELRKIFLHHFNRNEDEKKKKSRVLFIYWFVYDSLWFLQKDKNTKLKLNKIKNSRKKWRKSFVFSSSAPALKKPEVKVSEMFGAATAKSVASNNKRPKAKLFSNFWFSLLGYILFNISTL